MTNLMHVVIIVACHEGHDFWSCRCSNACDKFILLADPELRLAVGLSGLQGPSREKEKREKERNELRDLVIPEACNWFASL
jgi:hypothetical protein